MYGVLISGEVKVNGYIVEYNSEEGWYKRLDSSGSPVVSLSLAGWQGPAIAEPVPSLYTPSFITRYILVALQDRILIAPGSSIDFYFTIPVDLGVFIGVGDHYELVDTIPLGSYYKYALYGPPVTSDEAGGVVCRHWRSRVYSYRANVNQGECLVEASVVNDYSEPVVVSRILVDSAYIPLYYKQNTFNCYTGRVRLTVRNSQKGVVTYQGTTAPQGYIKARTPVELKHPLIPLIAQKTLMDWGI